MVYKYSLNIPLYLIGIKIKGKGFGKKTLYKLYFCLLHCFLLIYPSSTYRYIIIFFIWRSAVWNRSSFVFIAYGTTGGTDLAANILQHFIKQLSVGKIMMVLDGIIIFQGLLFLEL